jgi:hypothetical protein
MIEPKGSECQCAACGETFTGLGLFDAHQDRNYKRDPVIICALPVELGLVRNPRGAWGTPEGLKARENASTRLRRARSVRAS